MAPQHDGDDDGGAGDGTGGNAGAPQTTGSAGSTSRTQTLVGVLSVFGVLLLFAALGGALLVRRRRRRLHRAARAPLERAASVDGAAPVPLVAPAPATNINATSYRKRSSTTTSARLSAGAGVGVAAAGPSRGADIELGRVRRSRRVRTPPPVYSPAEQAGESAIAGAQHEEGEDTEEVRVADQSGNPTAESPHLADAPESTPITEQEDRATDDVETAEGIPVGPPPGLCVDDDGRHVPPRT